MVLRKTLFTNIDPSSYIRVDFLPCRFFVSLAKLYSKFEKDARKDEFEFDAEIIDSVRGRFKDTCKEWVNDIDFLYFPFNIDMNWWSGVMIDFLSFLRDPISPHKKWERKT